MNLIKDGVSMFTCDLKINYTNVYYILSNHKISYGLHNHINQSNLEFYFAIQI